MIESSWFLPLTALLALTTRLSILVFALATTTSCIQRVLTFFLILPFDLYLLYALEYGVTNPSLNGVKYLVGVSLAYTNANGVNLLILIPNPRKTFRKVAPDGKSYLPFPPKENFSERWWWAYGVVFSPRYIGYSYCIPHPIKPAYLDRIPFILNKVARIFVLWISTSLLWFAIAELNLVDFLRPVPVWWALDLDSSLLSQIVQRVGSAVVTVWSLHFVIVGVYDLCTIIAVALGQKPEEWPEFFGSLRESSTVAKAWGRTWHQFMRKIGTPLADLITTSLNLPSPKEAIPPNSSPSSKPTRTRAPTLGFAALIQLFIVFAVSGYLHAAGDYIVTHPTPSGTQWWSFRFFIIQPFAIIAESLVIGWWKGSSRSTVGTEREPLNGKTSSSSSSSSSSKSNSQSQSQLSSTPCLKRTLFKVLGFAWVVLWFSYTLPMFSGRFWVYVFDEQIEPNREFVRRVLRALGESWEWGNFVGDY